jgi:hypothetical protein
MIARLPGVTTVQDTGTVGGASAYRSPLIPLVETNALSVDAATLGLPAVAGTSLAQGPRRSGVRELRAICTGMKAVHNASVSTSGNTGGHEERRR